MEPVVTEDKRVEHHLQRLCRYLQRDYSEQTTFRLDAGDDGTLTLVYEPATGQPAEEPNG